VEADVAKKFFGNLVREAGEIARGVRAVDLEGLVVQGDYANL